MPSHVSPRSVQPLMAVLKLHAALLLLYWNPDVSVQLSLLYGMFSWIVQEESET